MQVVILFRDLADVLSEFSVTKEKVVTRFNLFYRWMSSDQHQRFHGVGSL